ITHHQTSCPTMSLTCDRSVQSRPKRLNLIDILSLKLISRSIFPRNQAYAPMPSAAHHKLTGVSHSSNVHKQQEQYGDENAVPENYSIKQACDRLGYDYRDLTEEK
ncbi:unnamed protein product, partial [Rotaria sp. Silwood2]